MKKPQNKEQPDKAPKQKILLDTNIISDLKDKNIQIPLTSYLLELVQRGFEFALSSVTMYELMRGLSIKNEKKMFEFISPYFRYFITDEVLITSAQLDNLMKMENINVNSVDHGDKIISATAILTGSLILTANVRDFPLPFFHEVEYKPLFYQDQKKKKKN